VVSLGQWAALATGACCCCCCRCRVIEHLLITLGLSDRCVFLTACCRVQHRPKSSPAPPTCIACPACCPRGGLAWGLVILAGSCQDEHTVCACHGISSN
jgi:hypothetical protein